MVKFESARIGARTTHHRHPINSDAGKPDTNEDGSIDIYFAPKAPEGWEKNWIQTIPGKSWFIILRLYGPLEPWLDQTWRPSELELVE